ncbi:MAG TPA: lipid-A-disaccharide synthase [Gemmataceae bacterium]|jgi:lipid-A-disaccharide synthase|nr:lipid-A-disaccharide synthase [Gemmataceae bacterium]
MHVFISAGEPSGDLHGANLIRELKALDPNVRLSGFGGDRMEAAGCQLLYPLCKHSVMWFFHVIKQIFTFLRLLDEAQEFFRKERPDIVVVIDYPGFHWKLAQRAKAEGIPLVYFVPPQIWAWAQWRVKKMRRLMTHVLSALPFEHEWLAKRGVPSTYIGHPYFDELAAQRLDESFLAAERAKPGRIVGILPGSRNQEVTRNIPEMLRAARRIHAALPDTRFLVAAFNDHQADKAREVAARWRMPLEVYVGRTPEIIELSECCIAVSGSVSLELMYRRKPAVIVYRLKRIDLKASSLFIKVRYITLVNLLANEMIYPEFLTDRDPSKGVADEILEFLCNPTRYAAVRTRLDALCDQVAKPGACTKAARFIVDLATQPINTARQSQTTH